MDKIRVMVNGIPGNVAVNIAKHILKDNRLKLIPFSMTGPEIIESRYNLDGSPIDLLKPGVRDDEIKKIIKNEKSFISVDYTHPSAVNENAEFYCRHDLPFVMGTTGGNRKLLENTVKESSISAVIAPNMAKQIVGFQAMLEWCADRFPGIFSEYSLEIRESHQKGKADTSGTAKAVAKSFVKMGIDFSENDIIQERDPKIQKTEWNIPEEYLKGHGYHTYTLISEDKTVKFSFTHNVNGRDVYARGTIDAILFLFNKIAAQLRGKVYTMVDVLKKV